MPPGPSIAWPVRRCDARGAALNGSLTIIVLTPLTTCSRGRSGRINQVSVFVGVFLIVRAGPATGRNSRARVFRAALPCLALIALIGNRSASANRHAGPVQRDAHQPGDIAGFAAAPDRGGGERSAQQSEAAGQRHEQARAVADRADPEIRPAGRERRRQFRLRLAQPQAQEAEILSGAGEAEAAGRSRQSAAADCVEHAAAAFDPALGVGQQDADPAGDGRHGGGPAAAQAPQDRRRSVRRGRRLRRQLPDQVRGRILRRLRHQSRPARRRRKASRST